MSICICACALVMQVTMVRGVYSTGKRPGRVQADVQRQPSIKHLPLYGARRGDLLARKPRTSNWAIWSILLFFIRAAPLTSFGEESSGQRLQPLSLLGEFLLPKFYMLGAPSQLEIGIAYFSRWPNDWGKAVTAPPPSLYLGNKVHHHLVP